MILEVFPEPVYKGEMVFSEEELSYFTRARQKGDYRNTYGNYTSNDSFVLENEELAGLKESVQKHLDYYLHNIIGASGVTLEITQSWLNFNDYGSSHHTHTHVNSIVSGVIYTTPNPAPLVVFKRQDYFPIRPMITNMTQYNNPMKVIEVKQGDIILFPSQLPHGVQSNKTNKTRTSLAFNTFYKGNLGSVPNLTHLEIS
jgi:uncharacterized protein (TIGR02466 family)